MNLLFVLVLIHASIGTVVKFDFVPPKSYELEVNQTRTNLKLKIGRNGDGHVIENLLRPLLDGSSHVGTEEPDKNCMKKTCQKKCVKRKKVCLKGDLDALLRESKKKNGAIYIRIGKAKRHRQHAKKAQNESATVRVVAINNGELIVSTAKKKYQQLDDKMKDVNSLHFNISEGDLPNRLCKPGNKGQHNKEHQSHIAENKGRHLGGKDSNNKKHASLKKKDDNININQHPGRSNKRNDLKTQKSSKQRHLKVNNKGNKRNGISRGNTYQERKRKGKRKRYDFLDKYNIVQETNVGFGQVIPITPNNLLSMNIPRQSSHPWRQHEREVNEKKVTNKRKHQRHGRMTDYLLPYYPLRDFRKGNAHSSLPLSSNLAKQYKMVMTTYIKFRRIPLNTNDVVVKLAGTRSEGQKQKHVGGNSRLIDKLRPFVNYSSERVSFLQKKGNDSNYDDYDDGGSIEIYEEITDECEGNNDFTLTSRCAPEITFQHRIENSAIYHVVEMFNVQIYLAKGEQTKNVRIYTHYSNKTTTNKAPSKGIHTTMPNITGSEVAETTTISATIVANFTESKSTDLGTTTIVTDSVTEPKSTATIVTDSVTEPESTATITSNTTDSKFTDFSVSIIVVKPTTQSEGLTNTIANTTDHVTTTTVIESIIESESTATIINNTTDSKSTDFEITTVVAEPTTQSKALTNTTANITDMESTNHVTTTMITEFITESIESGDTVTNIADITESKSTDSITTTNLAVSLTDSESTATIINNTTESKSTNFAITTVVAESTTQSEGSTNTIANITDTESTNHVATTTVVGSITESIESGDTVTNIDPITTTNLAGSLTDPESTTTIINNTTESKSTDVAITTVVAEPTTQSKDLVPTTANITDPESTNHVKTTTVAESITESFESGDTVTNIADITESKSTDPITTTNLAGSLTDPESTTTIRNNITTDFAITTVVAEPTTQSKDLITTTANITDTESTNHGTTTTVAESITEPTGSEGTATDIAESLTDPQSTATIASNTTETKSTDFVITTVAAEPITQTEGLTNAIANITDTESTNHVATTTAATSVDTIGNSPTITTDPSIAVTSSFEETSQYLLAQSMSTEEACELVEVEEEIDCNAMDEEDGDEIEEDCEEVEVTDEDCDSTTTTPNKTLKPGDAESKTSTQFIRETGEIETEDVSGTPDYNTTAEGAEETFITTSTNQEIDTTPDLWESYPEDGDGDDVSTVNVKSDDTIAKHSVIDHVLNKNEGLSRTKVNKTKENEDVVVIVPNIVVSEENNEKANLENGSRKIESSNLKKDRQDVSEKNSSKRVESAFSLQKLFDLMQHHHDPISNLFLRKESPLTNYSASKSEKKDENLDGEDPTLHAPYSQHTFLNETYTSESPSTLRKEESVVAFLRKISTKNKTASEEENDSIKTQNGPSRNEEAITREKSEKTNQSKDSDTPNCAGESAKENDNATQSRKDSNSEKSNLTPDLDSVKENVPGESESIVSAEEGTEVSKFQESAAEHIEEMNFTDDDYILPIRKESKSERAESNSERAESNSERAESNSERAESNSERAESKSERVESKSERAESKSERAESKSERVESKPERAESKSERAESNSERVESKPERAESKSERAESKSERAESNSERVESKSERAESKLERAESKPERAESKSERAESKSERVESKSERAESKSERAESKPERVESKSERAESKSERAESKPERAESKSERVESKSERAESKPERAESKLERAESNSERVESKSERVESKSERAESKSEDNSKLEQAESTVASDNRDSEESENETLADNKDLVIIGEEQDGKIDPENRVIKHNKKGEEKIEEDKPGSNRKDSTDIKLSEENDSSYQGIINNVYTENFFYRGKESNATSPQEISDDPKQKSNADNLQDNQETEGEQPKSEEEDENMQETQPRRDNTDLNADEDGDESDRKDENDEGDKDNEDEEDHGSEDGEDDESEDDDATDESQQPEDDASNKDSGNETEPPVEKRKANEEEENNNNHEGNGDSNQKSEELNDDRELPPEDDDPEKELHKRYNVVNDIMAERGKVVSGQSISTEHKISNMTRMLDDSKMDTKMKKRRKPPSLQAEFSGHIDSLQKVVYENEHAHWDDDDNVLLNFEDIPQEIISRVQNSDLTDLIVPMDMQHQNVAGRPTEVVTSSSARKDARTVKGKRGRRDQPLS